MEIHSDYVELATSALSYENVSFSKANDSGYHTFTPGSLECAEVSDELLDQSVITSNGITGITGQIQFGYFHVTPDVNIHRRYTSHSNESLLDTPPIRRGCKRPHSSTIEKADSLTNSIPTPTSFIAGKIKSLDVNENKENSDILSPLKSQCTDKIKRRLYQHDLDPIHCYPTTPVKKNCKRSPCKKSGKRPHFAIHSLSCESNELQCIKNRRVASKAVKNINFWPDQKIDIVRNLYGEAGAMLPLMNILSYLSNEDITNFNLVSHAWSNIWSSVSNNNKLKKNYEEYMKTVKANKENRDKGVTPKVNDMKLTRHLREIHNENNESPVKIKPGRSPPVSPKTFRFRKFMKSASLDSRSQLPCGRCNQPAKVTEEATGEVWVECTRFSCLYQFCKFCGCDRHPGKFCFQYDLDVPSPTKRKRSQYAAIGTKKSRRNLMRL